MFIDIRKMKIFVKPGATDLRKQQAGLAVVVQNIMKSDPFNGSLFLFCNRRRNLLKVLYWETNGFCMWQLCEASHNCQRQNPFLSQYTIFNNFRCRLQNKTGFLKTDRTSFCFAQAALILFFQSVYFNKRLFFYISSYRNKMCSDGYLFLCRNI